MLGDKAFGWLHELTETSKRSDAGVALHQVELESHGSVQSPSQV
jgi:hypothetical protein